MTEQVGYDKGETKATKILKASSMTNLENAINQYVIFLIWKNKRDNNVSACTMMICNKISTNSILLQHESKPNSDHFFPAVIKIFLSLHASELSCEREMNRSAFER